MLSEYIERLLAACPEITEIWLIGSRANDKEHAGSDWDLLVFGRPRTLATLQENLSLRRPDIDLLIVYNGNDFRAPWKTEAGKDKSGSLIRWKWKQDKGSPARAHYWGTQWKDVEIENTGNQQVAKRVWPKIELQPGG